MTELLVSDRKKIEILNALMDKKYHTYCNLAKRIKTNYQTVKKNCKFLEILSLIESIGVSKKESATHRPYYAVKITQKGVRLLKEKMV